MDTRKLPLKILVDPVRFICPFNYENRTNSFPGAKSIFRVMNQLNHSKYGYGYFNFRSNGIQETLSRYFIWLQQLIQQLGYFCLTNSKGLSQLYWFKLNLKEQKDVLLVQRSKLSAWPAYLKQRIKEMRQNRTFLPLNQIESYDNLNLANLKRQA
ncbi:Hypothetical_protein [Hexamita inflata]|uniref:Hypothetical_protein n=1 Tax=Hexamita inflata TaxID=28002 RepID=A0AA86TYS2_9EUKA|nr:Hypothetical protein HINF_LOCUS21419 [Hexamita inflata]